ncbi:MAG: antirepressor regulating drug resistance protein [Phycisphaerales bacterium]|nr:antirepressor regulating drug resistance protein [Phycisphaerales bacterium]
MNALLHIGLSNAVTAAVMAVVLIPLARLLRRAALTHAICVLILLKLITPPMWHVPVWRAAVGATRHEVAEIPASSRVPMPSDSEIDLPQDDEPLTSAPAQVTSPPVAISTHNTNWPAIISSMLLTGSALCVGLIAARLMSLRRLVRLASVAPREVQLCADSLADSLGLGTSPPVYFIAGSSPPMVLALFSRPRLLIPVRFWERLNATQRRTLLVHELAHLRRRDHWVRYLEVLVAVLYWWHPIAWWVRREMREAEEQCCDAWVVSSMPEAVRPYMATLLEAVEFLVNSPHPATATPMLASGMGQFHCLERRLIMVKQRTVRKSLSWGGLAAVCGLAGLLPLGPSFVGAQATEQTTANETARTDEVNGTESSGDPRAAAGKPRWEVVTRRADERPGAATVEVDSTSDDQPAGPRLIVRRETREDGASSKESPEVAQARERVRRLAQELNDAKLELAKLDPRSAVVLRLKEPPADRPAASRVRVRVEDGRIEAWDAPSGKKVWVWTTEGEKRIDSESVRVQDGWVTATTSDGKVLTLDRRTGKVLDQRQTNRSTDDRSSKDEKPAPADRERQLRMLEDKVDQLLDEVKKLKDRDGHGPGR